MKKTGWPDEEEEDDGASTHSGSAPIAFHLDDHRDLPEID